MDGLFSTYRPDNCLILINFWFKPENACRGRQKFGIIFFKDVLKGYIFSALCDATRRHYYTIDTMIVLNEL